VRRAHFFDGSVKEEKYCFGRVLNCFHILRKESEIRHKKNPEKLFSIVKIDGF